MQKVLFTYHLLTERSLQGNLRPRLWCIQGRGLRFLCLSESDKISNLPVFYVDEKFTHQVIYFNTKLSIFYAKVKIYTSSLLHCYQLPIFLTKVHICWSSFLLWYQVSFICMEYNFPLPSQLGRRNKKYMSSLYFHRSRRPGDDPVERAQVVWKLCALKFNMAMIMEDVFWNYFVITLFNQSNACLKLQDGDQAEFLSRRLEQYEHVLTPKGNMSSPRDKSDMTLSSLWTC